MKNDMSKANHGMVLSSQAGDILSPYYPKEGILMRKLIRNVLFSMLLVSMCIFVAVGSSPASEKMNLNTATVEQLETLPGIGPSLAERIVVRREQTPFASVEDIINVNGIGKKKYEELKEYITVE